MIHLKNIQSLTEFQRTARDTIKRLKKTGRPAALTVNGKAEIIVQDVASYQRLLDKAEEADKLLDLRRSIAEYRGGRTRGLDSALDDLEERHGGNPKQTRAGKG